MERITAEGKDVKTGTVTITKEQIDKYLTALKKAMREKLTITTYGRSLLDLYDFLPEGKEINADTLNAWRGSLRDKGYSESTINTRITAVNGYVRFCGRSDLARPFEKGGREVLSPGLTETEYIRFIASIREGGHVRDYLLAKVFASTGIEVRYLSCLTPEACRRHEAVCPDGKRCIIPSALADEMLRYAAGKGITEGPVFTTRSGRPLDRSNITNRLRSYAEGSGVAPEKCAPRALRKFHKTTMDKINEKFRPLVQQECDDMYRRREFNENLIVGRDRGNMGGIG